MRILDVGCGSKPKGDINTDLFTGFTSHHTSSINPKLIKNFIKCDAHFLPFKNKKFELVICDNVLEHLNNPIMALKELKRVGLNIKIIVPYSQLSIYLNESIEIFISFFAIPFLKTTEHFVNQLKNVKLWKKRFGENYIHKWKIKLNFDKKTIFRYCMIPSEVEYNIRCL